MPPPTQQLPARQTLLISALLVSVLLPSLSVHFPPLVDLPAHSMRFYVAYFAPPEARVHDFYDFSPVIVPNLGFDLLMSGLSFTMGFDAALRCAHLIVSGLICVAVYSLSRVLHGVLTVGSLFAVPFLMSWSYQMGFVNYVMSVCFALIGLMAYLQLRNQPLWQSTLVLVPISFVTWLCHIAGWGVFMLLICGVELALLWRSRALRPRPVGRYMLVSLICAGPTILTLSWLASFSSSTGGTINSQPTQKFIAVLGLFKLYWPLVDLAFYGLTLIAAAWLWRRLGLRIELGIGAVLLALAFLALPAGIGSTFFLDRRLLMPLGAVFFLALRPGGALAWAALPVSYSIAMAAAWVVVEAQQTDEVRSLDPVAPGDRVMSVALNRCLPPLQRWALPKHMASARAVVIQKDAFSNATFNLPASNGFRFLKEHPFDSYSIVTNSVYLSTDCPGVSFSPPTVTTIDRLSADLTPGSYDWFWLSNTDGQIYDLGPRYELMRTTAQTAFYKILPQ